MKYIFGILFVIVIILQCYLFKTNSETKQVKVKLDLVGCTSKIQVFTIPKYANLNLYSKNGSHYLQYKDLKGYYHTIAYNVLDFNEIE